MKVLVIGSTGRQGMAQMRQLKLAGYTPIALSRRPHPFKGTEFATVKTVQADLANEAEMRAAMAGVDYVFFTMPYLNMTDRSEMLNYLGRLAKDAGVKRFVWNTSSWIPERAGDAGPYAMNTAAVNALFRSGVPATVLGPVIFMDNLLTDWARPFIVDEKKYTYPHNPKLAANWICLDDVAKFMIAVLGRPDLEGSWLNLGGPERLLPQQIADTLSTVLGEDITYAPCSPAEFGNHLVTAFSDNISEGQADIYRTVVSDFYQFSNDTQLKPFEVDIEYQARRLPLEMETFSDWAKRQDWSGSNKGLRAPAG